MLEALPPPKKPKEFLWNFSFSTSGLDCAMGKVSMHLLRWFCYSHKKKWLEIVLFPPPVTKLEETAEFSALYMNEYPFLIAGWARLTCSHADPPAMLGCCILLSRSHLPGTVDCFFFSLQVDVSEGCKSVLKTLKVVYPVSVRREVAREVGFWECDFI